MTALFLAIRIDHRQAENSYVVPAFPFPCPLSCSADYRTRGLQDQRTREPETRGKDLSTRSGLQRASAEEKQRQKGNRVRGRGSEDQRITGRPFLFGPWRRRGTNQWEGPFQPVWSGGRCRGRASDAPPLVWLARQRPNGLAPGGRRRGKGGRGGG